MSIICLSSRGFSDTPSNFSNYFGGRGISFGKNSEICLVGASIKKQTPAYSEDGTITVPALNNAFAVHYGTVDGANENLFRSDLFTIPPLTLSTTAMAFEVSRILKQQCTISPLRYGFTKSTATPPAHPYGATFTLAGGLTIKANLWENRREQGGKWVPISNLPFAQENFINNLALQSQLVPTSTNEPNFAQDPRRLWNTDNFATVGDVATANKLNGARWNISYIAGGDETKMNGLQGGIVSGNRLQGFQTANSWINYPLEDAESLPQFQFFEQKIDLGWSIEGGKLCIFKNKFNPNFPGDITLGYERDYLTRVVVPIVPGVTQVNVLFRPLKSVPAGNYGWEALYKIGAAAYVALPYIPGTDSDGNFPMGMFNGNQRPDNPASGDDEGTDYGTGLNMVTAWPKNCIAGIRATGAYDDAYADATPLAVATPFGLTTQWGLSPVSDRYATGGAIGIPGSLLITNEFRQLLQTQCNIADVFGFFPGQIDQVTDLEATGLVSNLGIENWSEASYPYCIQLPNLPISGYLGGGASTMGGATACSILGIVDAYELDRGRASIAGLATLDTISSPYNDNWIKLENKDAFTVNEIQVRITDLYGQLPTDLGSTSHVWVKIRSNNIDTSI